MIIIIIKTDGNTHNSRLLLKFTWQKKKNVHQILSIFFQFSTLRNTPWTPNKKFALLSLRFPFNAKLVTINYGTPNFVLLGWLFLHTKLFDNLLFEAFDW